ncbi:hypothetical protein [Methylobacterium aquaticum]|uniref:Uncharacterized protein n=1 Tax=Methylobacterium aquaticum TaxID=270351 RepID=A0A0J6S5A2_9HYPH|nr:hypothetical protein [Methylobacterium aquaticum]KMO28859.1 hypothetical protein VP06_26205 [Methylobacterium aquaticum]
MLSIDQRGSGARLTLAEIVTAGRLHVSAPAAFAGFMAGLTLRPGLLAEDGWDRPAGAATGFARLRTLMHGVIPRVYDVTHLERLGGRFALRVDGGAGAAGIGDFTVVAVNRRVLTLSGLPLDEETGETVIDAAIRADAFLALWNDLLADLADATLARIEAARPARPPA